MDRVKKKQSISKIFAKYVIYFCITTIFLLLLYISLFALGLRNGVIIPANYYEQTIEKHREDISKAKIVKNLIPKECRYVVYNSNGKILESNVSEKEALDIWSIIKTDRTSKLFKVFYKIIQRQNSICVVEYRINASFSNATLRKYIKNPEWIGFLLLIMSFVFELIIFSKYFRKKLKREMNILKDATEKINMKNLDFEVKYSNISEINEVISALDKMKITLSESLAKQWEMEEVRKEQIGALAHDIKTPLTIIRGNSELLGELDLDAEQATFNNNILNEITNIECYIKSLIEITKSERGISIHKNKVNTLKFIDEIIDMGNSISKSKNIKFKSRIKELPNFIFVDEISMKRVINNIISNSVEYSLGNGEILLTVDYYNRYVRFVIEDSGEGFTKEELNLATEQFFQGDKSRNSKNHYGMGLYIARKLIEKHNGSIILQNSKLLKGAKVILSIPIE